MISPMHVVALTRYPLKSGRGEPLTAVNVDSGGLPGDRTWIAVDATDGTVGSAKHPGRWAGLLDVGATLTRDGCALSIAGRRTAAGTPEADAALSACLGRPMRLTRTAPAGARLHRQTPDTPGMRADWSAAAPGAELLTDLAGTTPAHHDFGPVHLLTTGALAGLEARVGHAVAAQRFRANVVLDLPADPEPGTTLTLGDAVLRVTVPTPRCIVPAVDPRPPFALDRELLATLAADYRRPVADLGRAACFGVYADVVRPGRLTLG